MNEGDQKEGPDLAGYLQSPVHARRMDDAIKRTVDQLSGIGRTDLFMMISEAIGIIYGVAHVYRTLGLKHQGAQVLRGAFKWLKTGTD